MRTKFKKPSLINQSIKKYRDLARNPSEFNSWKLIDLTKEERKGKTIEERKGKTIEELDALRKQKYSEQIAKINSMTQVSSENNMTQLFRKAQKAKQKKIAMQGGK